jgi:hypothetical protein
MDVVKGAGQLSETDCIEINPEVLLRQPVIRGNWIPAEMILRKPSEKLLAAEPGERYSRASPARASSDSGLRRGGHPS